MANKRTVIRLLQPADVPRVLAIYQDAFAGFPWYETLSDTELQARWKHDSEKAGFTAYVVEKDGLVVASGWHDAISIDQLRQERGNELADWVEQKLTIDPDRQVIWERELVVAQQYQRQRMATRLRGHSESNLKLSGNKFLVLARIREDNIASIRSARRFGFSKTGVRQAASTKPLKHDYWYRELN